MVWIRELRVTGRAVGNQEKSEESDKVLDNYSYYFTSV